jgi:hypothetical protein
MTSVASSALRKMAPPRPHQGACAVGVAAKRSGACMPGTGSWSGAGLPVKRGKGRKEGNGA